MRDLLRGAGARLRELGPVQVARHFGDPAGEYRASVEAVAVMDLSWRVRLEVGGRAPGRMLQGLLTSRIPEPERPVEVGVRAGQAHASAALTPKGRMVTDLRLFRTDGASGDATRADPIASPDGPSASPGPPEGGGVPAAGVARGPALAPGRGSGQERYLMDLPPGGLEPALEHFKRFLPPRFAEVEDVTDATGMLSVMGPDAPSILALHALGLRVDEGVLEALAEGEYRSVDTGSGTFLRVIRSDDVATPAWDLVGDRETIRGLWRTLVEAGARPAGHGVRETLRVEAGRPAWGADIDATTIPVEAGLGERLIDHGKGCYTGQEVIVRIRDRGHVNRHLRGLRLGDGVTHPAGTELYAPEVRGERPAGTLTTVVDSPRMGAVALGYVRREVEPPAEVRVGRPDGPVARVQSLEDEGWGPG